MSEIDDNEALQHERKHEEAPPTQRRISLPPYETIALMLQGGGALGAYQAGVYEGLHEADIHPNWIAGISIGAFNTAIIAGNAPEHRVERLREFWETICQPAFGFPLPAFVERAFFDSADVIRKAFTALQAVDALVEGQKGFFVPRFPPPSPVAAGSPQTASYYDTTPLKATLERLCDFDRINSRETRVSVGAVNVATGNFAYFDNTRTRLRAEHFLASGALPPGFAAVEIDGQFYWDGGLMSNTPLYEVAQATPRRDTLAFQVDLWSARGPVPDNVVDVMGRVKDVQYSSRTRLVTDDMQRAQRYRNVLKHVLDLVPEELRDTDEWCRRAAELACSKRYNIIHLIYQQKEYEGQYKDYQFGFSTMREHWETGLADIRRTLAHRDWLDMPNGKSGFVTHDIHRERG
ncbi:patatin-like phospholipase family protein [Caballeronia sp. LZ062]|uniref:patatin-like phospholipase family protein n=1 Tax=unclassified Caballeronia TaxID=2646786 RepID=UPI002862C6F8|nr:MULTISPECIES: patatin-like phospholipase family protein [unclassified Caballeronia]MDR5854765.1 patatin-like phospholipase family protein [Caballeronia sp. LZ050]MDR5870706.1 patatin-like phospholipase family protein [Caballeronia sp. LZ062]